MLVKYLNRFAAQSRFVISMSKILANVPLRTVLVVPFMLQTVAIAGLVGYLSFRNGQKAVKDVTSQLRSELTNHIKQQLEGYVKAPVLINQLDVGALARGEIDIINTKGEAHFWQQAKLFPSTSFVYCGSEQGGEMFGVTRGPNKGQELQVAMTNSSTGHRFYYYGVDSSGNRTSLLEKGKAIYDARRRPWYKAARMAGGPTWSEIYLDFAWLLPTITASVPIYDRTSKSLIGVCATDLFLPKEFSTFLRSLRIGRSGQTFVVERSGVLVSSSTEEPITAGNGKKTTRLKAQESSNPLVRGTGQYLSDRFGDLRQIQSPQQLDFQLDGKRQLVQVTPFQDGRSLDWLIVVVIPESDFMEQINANTRTTILLCIAAAIAAIGIGILTTRWIAEPIIRLNIAAKDVARGEWHKSVDIHRSDEVGELAKSFNSMAGQLKESFETLEDKVKERTAELATANEEIIALNEKLKADNLRMGAELNVVRQMQQMILPRPEELEIDGLDIAGYMDAADEVGGDYYDVLNIDGIVTLGIGDVTGHGLESGILMLMAQTAVRTLKEIREVDPVRFLDVLNRTLYKNVQRMKSEKCLTLAILNYSKGWVSISGQHEETIIVRQGGAIERVDTMDLGFPIALNDDIAAFISHVSIQLQPGDGVVLYTDGIPEAFNIHKKQYGVEQMCEVIGQNWQLSAGEIKQAVIADVRRHIGTQKVFDDITLLILKRTGVRTLEDTVMCCQAPNA